MIHLTTSEVMEIVDGTISDGVRTRLLAHLEECPMCRLEVEFQKSLEKVAKSAPLARPSRDLTSRVMSAISPHARKTLLSKFIDNLGNIFAMGLVLTVVWYVSSNPGLLQGDKHQTAFTDAAKTYVDFYSSARAFVAKEGARWIGEPTKDRASGSSNIIVMTVISVLILVVVDRFVVRRVIKIRA